MKQKYKIGEIVEKFNITKETIRHYERIGLLSEPKREENGYRVYTDEDINILWFILISKKFGFTLKEIKLLLGEMYHQIKNGNPLSILSIISDKINEINNRIGQLENTKQLLIKAESNIRGSKCFNDMEKFLENP